jgi:hypothetical protein
LNETIYVDPALLMATILGDCAVGQSSGTSYLQSLMNSISSPLSRYPEHFVDDLLTSHSSDAFYPRSSLRNAVISGAQLAGSATAFTVANISSVLTCNALNSGVLEIKESVCCGFM